MNWLVPRRSLGIKRRSQSPYWMPLGNHKFDESTGQIYTERTTAIQSSDDSNWTRKCRVVLGPFLSDGEDHAEQAKSWGMGRTTEDLSQHQKHLDNVKNSKVKGRKGARSLQDAAIECIIQNISDITLEGIDCLPIQIVRQIWHAVNRRCTMCFNTWSIFSKILHNSDMATLELLRYRQAILNPSSPLQVYANPLSSKSFDFLTSLSITTTFPVPDLVQLSNIPNIAVLEIINLPRAIGYEIRTQNFAQGVGDRLIRAWYSAAVNGGAFRVLRILKMCNHEDLTANSMNFLNGFPALALYDVRGCNFGRDVESSAKRLGWRSAFSRNVLDLLDGWCKDEAFSANEDQTFKFPSQSAVPQPLWDGSKIRRIRRGEVSNFRALRAAVAVMNIPSLQSEHDGSKKGRQTKQLREEKGIGHNNAGNTKIKAPETWDFTTHTAFARVGELRGDLDLLKAGVPLGDQAVVGDELVNSVPMASLRLGPTPRVSSTSKALVFIRIRQPPQVSANAMDGHTLRSWDKSARNGTFKSPSQNLSQLKHRVPKVTRAKKRKLDDVLNSFL